MKKNTCPNCNKPSVNIHVHGPNYLRTQTAPWSYACGVCGAYIGIFSVNKNSPFGDFNEVAEKLLKLGWDCRNDAQFSHLKKWCEELTLQWNTRTPNEATKELMEDKVRLDWAMMNPHKFTKFMEMEAYGGFLKEELAKGRTAISNAMKQEK